MSSNRVSATSRRSKAGVDPETLTILRNEFADRHFLVYHCSVSRLRRLKAQLVINACVDADSVSTRWKERDPPTPAQIKEMRQQKHQQQQQQQVVSSSSSPSSDDDGSNGGDDRDEAAKQQGEDGRGGGGGSEGQQRQQRPQQSIAPNYPPHPIAGTFNCEIRMITDPAHPAFRQCGLFAARKIPGNHVLMSYAGLVSIFGSVPSSQSYVMTYGNENGDLGIDAEFFGNFARFANDPRGTGAAQANVSAQMKHSRLGEFFTCLVTRRTIAEGEEILLDYGKRHRLCAHLWSARSGRSLTLERPVRPVSDLASVTDSADLSVRAVWRCFQCGQWNDGGPLKHVPAAVAVKCVHCSQPKSADTPTCVAKVPQSPEEQQQQQQQHAVRSGNTKLLMFPHDKDTLCSPQYVGQRAAVVSKLQGAEKMELQPIASSSNDPMQRETIKAKAAETSVAAEWPRQFPFVPWQIWDPEVATFEVNVAAKKHQPQTSVVVSLTSEHQPSSSTHYKQNKRKSANKNNNSSKSSFAAIAKRRRNRARDDDDDDDDDDDHDDDDDSRLGLSAVSAAARSAEQLCLFAHLDISPQQEIAAAGGLVADTAWQVPAQTPNMHLRVLTRYVTRVSSRLTIVASAGDMDKPQTALIRPASMSPQEMVRKCAKRNNSDNNDDAQEEAPLDFEFYATNEVKHIRIAQTSGSDCAALPRAAFVTNPSSSFVPDRAVVPNVTLHWIRDPMGFVYFGLVSLKRIDLWDELIL